MREINIPRPITVRNQILTPDGLHPGHHEDITIQSSFFWYSQKSPFPRFTGVIRPGPPPHNRALKKRFFCFCTSGAGFSRIQLYLGYYLGESFCQAIYHKLDCDCQDEDCHQLWNDF